MAYWNHDFILRKFIKSNKPDKYNTFENMIKDPSPTFAKKHSQMDIVTPFCPIYFKYLYDLFYPIMIGKVIYPLVSSFLLS